MATTATAMYNVVTKIDGTTIEFVETLPIPKGKCGTIDITNQDSGWGIEKMVGKYDPGDITITGVWTAGKPGINALKTASNDTKQHQFEVDLPDGTKITFSAYVGAFTITPDKDRATYNCDIAPQGIPTIATTYTALTSAFACFAQDGSTSISTVYPTPAVTPGKYVLTSATATGVVVQPTCSTSGAVIYVNDTAVTSAAKSTSKDISSSAITTITIRVVEAGKADAYYFIEAIKTA